MDLQTQISKHALVCPRTRAELQWSRDRQWLVTADEKHRYPVNGGVPILLADSESTLVYSQQSEAMNRDYAESRQARGRSLAHRLAANDYRTPASKRAFDGVFATLPFDALCLAPGGGPVRAHPRLVNVNIAAFENVDVVGDAHALPYADNSVDAVHSEAVFEHLVDPTKAARELFRVMKPGARAFVAMPFLQQYHGYPHHYQNYTLQGHQLLFSRVGFAVLEAGHCVGPVVALTALVSAFLREYLPRPIGAVARVLWGAITVMLRPIDRLLWKHEGAHILASTTYVVIEKPAPVPLNA